VKTVAELRVAVGEAVDAMEAALAACQNPQGRSLASAERAFDSARDKHARLRRELDTAEAIAEARKGIPAEAAPAAPTDGWLEVRDGARLVEPLTYQRHSEHSIFADMVDAHKGGQAAIERLNRHREETAAEQIRLTEERERYGVAQDRAAITQTAGEGGELIAPAYLQNQWIGLPRAGRPIANSLNSRDWIQTNTINLPKVSSGATVATQTDTGSVSSTAIKTELITGVAQTVAGQQDAAQSLVDLSLPGVAEVIFDDLTRAYDQQLDVKVIENAVTNAKGINGVTGVNSITFTAASPKFSEFYKKIAAAIGEVNTGVFAPPQVIAMTPLRWAWCLSQVDTQERPLIVPVGQPGFNAGAMQERVAAENVVGSIQGVPVIVDASIPTNKGAGTNQDEVYVYRADNLYLWESTPTLRILSEVLSGKLEVRFQLYGYYTPIFGRLPKSISKITGTGLVTPTF
jgi:HK97 family phage major capsid protein